MDRASTEQLIRNIFDARKAGEVDDVMRYLTPDVSLRFPGSPASETLARESSSRDSVRAHLVDLVREWRWTGYEIVSTLIDGDSVAVHIRQSVVHTPTGKANTVEVVDLIELRDGKVCAFVEFVDTALVASLAQR